MAPTNNKKMRRVVAGTLLAVAAGAVILAAAPMAGRAQTPGAAAGDAPAPAGTAAASATVRIIMNTVPPAKGMIFWGKKRLGLFAPREPLIIQRPRDSGPLDLMVRADGFLPVQTRVYTFADNKITVKLTPPDQKKTLLGYREPPPPDAAAPGGSLPGEGLGASPDGGAPP